MVLAFGLTLVQLLREAVHPPLPTATS
jgi:hypothetical protein